MTPTEEIIKELNQAISALTTTLLEISGKCKEAMQKSVEALERAKTAAKLL